jgi:hypothetical protein
MPDGMKIERVRLFQVTIDPAACIGSWTGLFIEQPGPREILAAIYIDIDELDSGVEHEADCIQMLRDITDLVRVADRDMYRRITVAGTFLGEISSQLIKGFSLEPESMMPKVSVLPACETSLGELLTTDPRTGEKYPPSIQLSVDGLTESQRRNLASEHMRGGQ